MTKEEAIALIKKKQSGESLTKQEQDNLKKAIIVLSQII